MVLTNLYPPPPPHGEKCTVNIITIHNIIVPPRQQQGGHATLRPAADAVIDVILRPISLNRNHRSVVAKAIHLLPFRGGRHPPATGPSPVKSMIFTVVSIITSLPLVIFAIVHLILLKTCNAAAAATVTTTATATATTKATVAGTTGGDDDGSDEDLEDDEYDDDDDSVEDDDDSDEDDGDDEY